MKSSIRIGEHEVGEGCPPYVIAEIGSNHNGDMGLCRRTIDAACEAGVDAVKFQSWSTTSLVSEEEYERNRSYSDKKRHPKSLREMVRDYALSPARHHEMKAYCDQLGVDFLSSVFSEPEVALLDDVGAPALKIASMDVNHHQLLRRAGGSGLPVLLSTGMASTAEIARAIEVLVASGCEELAILHCVSVYPAPPEILNLRNIRTLRAAFGVPVGFSDHSLGTAAPVAAVALGARIIEKHFTLDRELDGWDHWMSVEPDEMAKLCVDVRCGFDALGSTVRRVGSEEREKRESFRRSVVASRHLPSGSVLSLEDFDFKRPGTGVSPDQVTTLVGRTTRRELATDAVVKMEDVE